MKLTNKIKSITIGSFDGIHIAHRRLIDQADLLVVIERHSGYLTPGYKRANYTDKPCAFYLFDKVKSLTPREFMTQLKEDYPMLERVVVGYDFHFGRGKSGDAEHLRELFDGEVVIVNEVSEGNIPVHSRTIKRYLGEGNMAMVTQFLKRAYSIDGEIIPGQGLGGRELVPTLNLSVRHYQLPMEGVYATETKIDGEWLPSVSFLGHRETIDGSYAIETHILSGDIGIVDGVVSMRFIEFVRENKKFDGLDALRQAIDKDIEIAESLIKDFRMID